MSSVHQEGSGEHSVDAEGHLVLKEKVSNGTLPKINKDGKESYPCRSAGVTRDGLFRWESCQTIGHTTFRENPTITDRRENIFYTKTGALVGVVKETTRDTINARFAEHDGHDYLLVLEGGTKLKVYQITDPHQ